jgi:hypothetical protein
MTVFPLVYRPAKLGPEAVTNTSLRSEEKEYTARGVYITLEKFKDEQNQHHRLRLGALSEVRRKPGFIVSAPSTKHQQKNVRHHRPI